MDTGSLFRGEGESDRGVALHTDHHLTPRLKKKYGYTSALSLELNGLP